MQDKRSKFELSAGLAKAGLQTAKYRGVFDYPCVRSKNLLDGIGADTSDHVLEFMGWTSTAQPKYLGRPTSRVLDQRDEWMRKWLQGGSTKQSKAISCIREQKAPDWVQLGMQSTDQFDFGAPKHPCSICGSEDRHRHARRPGDKPQIDTENLRKVPALQGEIQWPKFRDDGQSIFAPLEEVIIHKRNLNILKIDGRDKAFEAFTVLAGKIWEPMRGWVRSQKRNLTYEQMMGVERGPYKSVPIYSEYNQSDESDGGDDMGVSAPISAHKTHKYYGGNEDSPEDRTTGWSPLVASPCSPEFLKREKHMLRLACRCVKQTRELFTVEGVFGGTHGIIRHITADEYEQQRRIQLVIPSYRSFLAIGRDSNWQPGKVHRCGPVYGYGRFVVPRHPQWRDPAVSVAGERLIWEQVWQLCERDGLIRTEKWSEPYCVMCGHYLTRLNDPAHVGHSVYLKPQTHSYGRSIRYPDDAFKYETFVNVTHIPNLDKWESMIATECKLLEGKTAVAEKLKERPLPTTSKFDPKVLEKVLRKPRVTDKDIQKVGSKNRAAFNTLLSKIRAGKIGLDDSDELWERLLEGKEPGVYAIANLQNSPARAYRITDSDSASEELVENFRQMVMEIVYQRSEKGRVQSLNGEGEVWRKRAVKGGYEPLDDQELLTLREYRDVAFAMLARPWRIWPKTTEWLYADDQWGVVVDLLLFELRQAGMMPESR